MTDAKFEELVRGLEPFAKRKPAQYRLRVGLLAALGYLYVLFVLALLIGLVVAMAAALILGHGSFLVIKLAIPLVVAASVIVRSLWVKIPPPQEPELRLETAPRLFALLDELSQALKAPRLHHVMLTDDFNAAIVQIPRLGLFGWQTNYLILGLPLMEALSPAQFRAVVAHELGHLSGNHSRFSGWIYRVRQTWVQILSNLHDRGHWGVRLFTGFFHWYAPFFGAYSFVLARADEYVADRCSAEVAGRQNAAEALVSLQLRGRFLSETFWPDVRRQSYFQAEPPAALYGTMFRSVHQALPPSDAEVWLGQALAERTGLDDTHPCLTDRLVALGFHGKAGGPLDPPQPPLPAPETPTETAARTLLGPVAESHTAQLDRQWRQSVAQRWTEQYQEAQNARRDLDLLERQAREGPLSADDAWKRARLTAAFVDEQSALPLLTALVAAHPDHALAAFALGKALLESGDARGLTYLESAMRREPASIVPASEAAYRFLIERGQTAEAVKYQQRAQQSRQEQAQAREERSGLNKSDRLIYHGLTPDDLVGLRAQLIRFPQIKETYLARKHVAHFPDQPLFVLGIVMKKSALQSHSNEAEAQALIRRLPAEIQLPGEAFLVLMNRRNAWLAKALRGLSSAPVYQAG